MAMRRLPTLLLLLATPAARAQVEIELWHSYRAEEREALDRSVASFNTSHAGIRIKTSFITFDAYLDKLTASIPRGHGPDIFIAPHDRIGGWADSGHLAPLDAYLRPGVLDRFFEKTVGPLRYRRKLYGLPTAFKNALLFYNRALVPGPPDDTDEMIAIARRLADMRTPEGQPVYGLAYEHTKLYFHACWLYGFGGSIFDPHQELVLDAPQNAASVAFVVQLAGEPGLMPQDVDGVKVTTMFNAGRAGMVINGPWFRGEIADSIDYGVAVLPRISLRGQPARPFVSVEAFMLSATANHPEEAYQAMEWLTRDRAAGIRMHQGKQTVANLALYDTPEVRADPVLSVFRDQLKHAVPLRNQPEMAMVWVPVEHALLNAVTGRMTPKQALAEAQQRAGHRIREFRKGHALKDAGSAQEELHRAILWGTGGALLVMLLMIAVFFRRFRRMVRAAWEAKSAYAYVTPAVLAVVLLVFVPFLVGLGLGFFRHYQGDYYYVGMQNFADILSSR